MKVQESLFIQRKKPLLKKLLDMLLEQYPYASILTEDAKSGNYSVSRKNMSVGEGERGTSRGFVVKVSDGKAVPAEICFVQNWGGKQTAGTVTPQKLAVNKFSVTNGLYNSSDLAALVFDQYGDVMELVNGTLRNEGWEVEFAVSDIKENTDEFAHVPNSFSVSKNNSADATITGAEIKDSFKLTATVDGTAVSATIPVTVNADGYAKVMNTWDGDKELRAELGYTR